jgi:hypothetical protein
MIAYPATLDVPLELVGYVSRLLAAERRARGTRWRSRALTCWKQALFLLVWFRKQEDLAVLGAGFGISRATAYRYHDEGVTVLADQAPDLHQALARAHDEGFAYVILDGKVFDSDRCGEQTTSVRGKPIDLWYSGKTHTHGGNIQALSARQQDCHCGSAMSSPARFTTWSPPASTYWPHCIGRRRSWICRRWLTAATKEPASACIPRSNSPPTGRALEVDNRTYNSLLRGLRCLGERGFAVLVGRWRTLRHFTCSPTKIGVIVKAALVLSHFEYGRIA